MKLPQFSLRTMLVAVAIVAVALGWLRYESQRGWTVAKFERLIKDEFNSDWDRLSFDDWVRRHSFNPGWGSKFTLQWYEGSNPELIDEIRTASIDSDRGSNLGVLRGRGSITAYFYYQNGHCISYSIQKAEEYAK